MSVKKQQFSVYGMDCQACATRIEKVLNKSPAVEEANVNFATEEANVTYKQGEIQDEGVIALIQKAGYDASVKKLMGDNSDTKEEATPWRLILLWLIAVPFLVGMVGMFPKFHALMLPDGAQFVLSTFAQLFLTKPIYKGAWASIRGGLANMDVLVVLGTTAIWLYSTVLYLWPIPGEPNYLYFEANVMVLAFITLGKYIEAKTKHGSLNSLNKMLELLPQKAEVWRNNEWKSLSYSDIHPGDRVKSGLGDKICADGVVVEGRAWLDVSHLTGESVPVEAGKGVKVLAGSVVTDGLIEYKVETLGEKTRLGDMITALNNALATKAPLARIADQAAGVFVPVVVIIAVITLIANYLVLGSFSQALVNAVAVLVIACPCALGLATPAAIMVGMGLGSKNNVWFKNAEMMEATAKIDTVVLDKTGTITTGQLSVAGEYAAPDSPFKADELLAFIAAAEGGNTHPIAKIFVATAKDKGLKIPQASDVKNSVGLGLEARLPKIGKVKVGNLAFTKVKLPPRLAHDWETYTVIGIAAEGKPLGAFALSDTLKADSQDALNYLQQALKIDTYILSGDKQSVVSVLAQKLGIPAAQAKGEQSPTDKLNQVRGLVGKGKRVAMVGDGVNDAAALAAATIGMAMSNGSEIANQTAGVTLTQHSLTDVVHALQIGTATVRNIKENLFFAFVYNVIGIPLAAFGFLTPIFAGLAMSLSSISVLANALRLKRARLFHKEA